ncbi:unnamed protein product [Cuscuta epithymum]|uniref:Uncharacterized protein n=1 Tax=Cuscuta epithymum TaxID=186058 RepID=A0AAV0FUU4_9ASTE|nr:unnamed protein product [Cuscuta epithymum]
MIVSVLGSYDSSYDLLDQSPIRARISSLTTLAERDNKPSNMGNGISLSTKPHSTLPINPTSSKAEELQKWRNPFGLPAKSICSLKVSLWYMACSNCLKTVYADCDTWFFCMHCDKEDAYGTPRFDIKLPMKYVVNLF